MAYRKRTNFFTILLGVLVVGIGLVALAAFYKAAMTPIRDRSRAGLVKEVVLKSWIFKTKDQQGWKGNLKKLQATGFALQGIVNKNKKSGYVENRSVLLKSATEGKYKVKIALAIIPSLGKGEEDEPIPIGDQLPRSSNVEVGDTSLPIPCTVAPPPPSCFPEGKMVCTYGRPILPCEPTPDPPYRTSIPMTVTYGAAKKEEKTVSFMAYPDGYLHTYDVVLPDVTLSMSWLRIGFGSYETNYMIQIPYISVVQQPTVTPTFTPTPTVSPTPTFLNKISWHTPTVSLAADDFYILANGTKFFGKPDPGTTMTIGSDPGNATYTTLETVWTEHGAEMRLFMYFRADTANWWAFEIRTYDGVKYLPPISYPNWIYYYGPYFKGPLGTSLVVFGETKLTSAPNNTYSGNIYFNNLSLTVNFRPVSPPPTRTPTITPAPTLVVCSLDAQQCPDGSYVGRIGPNCEFAQCPAVGGN